MKFPCKFIIYRFRCIPTSKSYIGFTVMGLEKRWKSHLASAKSYTSKGKSLTYLWKAINRYGKDCWEKTELYSGIANSLDDIAREERRFICSEGTKVPNGYNLTDGGEGCVGCTRSEDFKKKLRIIHLGMKASKEARRNMSLSRKGRIFSKEHRDNLSRAQMGEKNHQFGKRASLELRERLSIIHSGPRNHFYGKNHSPESIEKMVKNSKPRFGKENHATRAVEVDGVRYGSMSNAAKFVGISLPGIHKRINSDKWPKYKYLEITP